MKKEEKKDEKEKPEERQNTREGIRTFKTRYFIVASLAVKRALRVKETTVKKTKTTTLATATAMKRAVGLRVRSKLHENPIVVCSLEILVQARQRWIKAESTKGLENYYNGKRRIGRVVAAVIRGDAICTCCCQHSLCIKLY